MTSNKKVVHAYNSFTITGVSVFVIVFIVAGFMFAYERYLASIIDKMEEERIDIEEAFSSDLINDLTVADVRVRVSEGLLNDRVAPSIIFALLSNYTSENVYFDNFFYRSHQVEEDGFTNVRLQGIAPTFNAVAYQSDVFKGIEGVANVTVRNIRLIEGRVAFEALLSFEKREVLYAKEI